MKENSININEINKLLEKEATDENSLKKISKEYQKKITTVMDHFTANPDLLQSNNLKISSPKMNEMLKLLLKSNGLSFVYSSFKILEGLDIFSKVLEANGYQEFDLKNKNKKS